MNRGPEIALLVGVPFAFTGPVISYGGLFVVGVILTAGAVIAAFIREAGEA